MHHPTDRMTHTTAFVTPVVEHWLQREIAQWVHPMKDRSDDPSHHELRLAPCLFNGWDFRKDTLSLIFTAYSPTYSQQLEGDSRR